MHASPLIAMIVIGLVLAFVLGTLANRLRISPIVGYLLAGVVVGPFTPGFVADQNLALQLADIGVILLMFGVGLHFSLKDLLAVRRVVIPGAIVQIGGGTLLGLAVAQVLGWSVGAGLVFGLSLSVASTVVLTRGLHERRLMDTDRGRVAVGWLVVQDMLTVIALVLLPPLAALLKGDPAQAQSGIDFGALALTLAVTLGKLAAFIALMFVVGRRVIPMILHYIAHTGSRELFRLAVLSVALGVAFAAAELFGVSFALGAFFAGMILNESTLSQRAAEETLPLRDAFAVLFFISVGMLFDPAVLLHEPLTLMATLAVVLIGNAGIAFLMVRLFGYPLGAALMIGAGLAQIGEFSFILADLSIGLGLLTERARDLILGTSILSILANPIFFGLAERVTRRAAHVETAAAAKAEAAAAPAEPEHKPTSLTAHAVLVGCGRVGSIVAAALRERGEPFLVIEDSDKLVAKLHADGTEVIDGNAVRADVLEAANLAEARILFIAIPNAFEAGRIVERAQAMNPNVEIIVRAHSDDEVEYLKKLGSDAVIMGEREIARGMIEHAFAITMV